VIVPPLTWLYVPANRPELVAKALASRAHAVIVDLEDAVPPDAKPAARSALGELLAGPFEKPVCVRVNGLATPWGRDDIAAVATLTHVAALLVPRVASALDVHAVDAELMQAGSDLGIRCLIESARGVEAAAEIAAASPRVLAVSLGEADLRGELRCEEDGLDYARSRVVLAAAAAGLGRPPQSVYPRLRDPDGLARSCARGRALGHLGRAAIHPEQLAAIERAYLPSERELEAARDVLRGPAGARTQADGAFVDAAFHAAAAETVALAERYG
jgi:citrate lyase subunit beta/citryl-CoA lyase